MEKTKSNPSMLDMESLKVMVSGSLLEQEESVMQLLCISEHLVTAKKTASELMDSCSKSDLSSDFIKKCIFENANEVFMGVGEAIQQAYNALSYIISEGLINATNLNENH